MTVKEAIEAERVEQMKPLLPWCTAEPCIRIPFTAVLVDKERECVYVTLASLASAVES